MVYYRGWQLAAHRLNPFHGEEITGPYKIFFFNVGFPHILDI